jgi:hypothetical protein
MSIKDTAKYRILANAIQTSFGHSSLLKYPTHFVKANVISDEHIRFMCQTTVTFGHENVFHALRKKYINECLELVAKTMKRIETAYVEEIEIKGKLLEPKVEPYEKAPPKSIKLKLIDETLQDEIEHLSYSIYNVKKTVFFRIFIVAKIS